MEITKSTLVRFVLIFVVIINFILEKCGVDIIPVNENTVLMFIETAIEIGVIAVGFWKNNSFTENAIKADEFLKELKASE